MSEEGPPRISVYTSVSGVHFRIGVQGFTLRDTEEVPDDDDQEHHRLFMAEQLRKALSRLGPVDDGQEPVA